MEVGLLLQEIILIRTDAKTRYRNCLDLSTQRLSSLIFISVGGHKIEPIKIIMDIISSSTSTVLRLKYYCEVHSYIRLNYFNSLVCVQRLSFRSSMTPKCVQEILRTSLLIDFGMSPLMRLSPIIKGSNTLFRPVRFILIIPNPSLSFRALIKFPWLPMGGAFAKNEIGT